jgi:hypothetical protein
MRGRRIVTGLAAAAGFSLAAAAFSASVAQGAGWWKFLFTPQAGLDAVCLSCGWHDACVWPYSWGTALDFPASCSDAGYDVYFRSFGFKASGGDEWVAFGTPLTRTATLCTETMVRVRDKDASTTLGWMHYMHTYRTRSADMLMYVNEDGRLNEDVFAGMDHDPEHRENPGCVSAGYWTGPHVHEYHEDSDGAFLLRDDADCDANDRYPCAPDGGGPYDPQDWWNDWAREFCGGDESDCDQWADDGESHIDTDPSDACADTTTANDEHPDPWAPDFNDNRVVDITDAGLFCAHYPSSLSSPNYDHRFDLSPDGVIDIADAGLFLEYFPSVC